MELKLVYGKEIMENPQMLDAFNQVMIDIFAFSFTPWLMLESKKDEFIPIALIDHGAIIATTYVFLMKIVSGKKTYHAAQVGGVSVIPSYRNQGITKQLFAEIETIFTDVDFFFLYALDHLLDFYPHFGYQLTDTCSYLIEKVEPNNLFCFTQLDISSGIHKIEKLMRQLPSISLINDLQGLNLRLFSVPFNANDFYYDPKHQVLVMCHFEGDMIHIDEIFAKLHYPLERIIGSLIDSPKNALINFPISDAEKYKKQILSENLFIKKNKEVSLVSYKIPSLLKS